MPEHLSFIVHGRKLSGGFALTRTGYTRWILVKVRDEDARPGSDIVAERPESVRSGRTWQELVRPVQGLALSAEGVAALAAIQPAFAGLDCSRSPGSWPVPGCYTPPSRVSWSAHSRWRSTNFWVLPVDVFGSGANSIESGHL